MATHNGPVNPVELDERLFTVISLRAAGVPAKEIADSLGLSVPRVYQYLAEATTAARERNVDLVEEMFLLHQERLERLFRLAQAHIDKCETFDDRAFRVAILILERQARLLGLDKTPEKPGGKSGGYDWLENSTKEELIAEAERRGLRVPEKFKLG